MKEALEPDTTEANREAIPATRIPFLAYFEVASIEAR